MHFYQGEKLVLLSGECLVLLTGRVSCSPCRELSGTPSRELPGISSRPVNPARRAPRSSALLCHPWAFPRALIYLQAGTEYGERPCGPLLTATPYPRSIPVAPVARKRRRHGWFTESVLQWTGSRGSDPGRGHMGRRFTLAPDDPCLRAYRIDSVCDAGMVAQDSPWMRGNCMGHTRS